MCSAPSVHDVMRNKDWERLDHNGLKDSWIQMVRTAMAISISGSLVWEVLNVLSANDPT